MKQTQSPSSVPLSLTSYLRLGGGMLVFTFVLLFGWAALAPLNSAVVATGRISVASENKQVQHLDGGLVTRILVKDGDRVEAGQSLLALDSEPLTIRNDQVKEQLLEIRSNLARLAAERDGAEQLRFSGLLSGQARTARQEEMFKTQRQLFESRRSARGSEQNILEQRRLQTQKQLDGGEKLIASLQRRLELLQQEYQTNKELGKRKVVAESRVREIEGNLVALQGEIISQQSEMARLRESLAEAEFNATLREQEYRKEVISQLRDLQSQLTDLQAEERGIAEKLGRIRILAPVSGEIKGFDVVTLGAVITAGQVIMEIVPLEQDFKIQAQVLPMDIDSLHPGLKAEVRIPAFDGARRFPSLFADLSEVSNDTYQDNHSQETYYKANLLMDSQSLSVLSAEQFELVSGMPVEVIIKTGERTLANYLLRPLSDMLDKAFNEA